MQKRHQTAQVSQEHDSLAKIQKRQKTEEPSNVQTHDSHPLENISCRIGDSACAAKHATVIQRTGLFHPMNHRQKVQSLLKLQKQYGNRFVQRVIAQHLIQTKMQVGQPGDVYEQEADRVADAVMHMPESQIQHQAKEVESVQTKPMVEQITPLVQRQEEEKEELAPMLQRQEEEKEELAPMLQRQEEEKEELAPMLQRQEEEKEELAPMLQRQEEEEDKSQAKEMPGQTSEVSTDLEARIQSARGGGQALPESARAFFEPRFGSDFSQVQAHTDVEADALNRSLNARAFTTGQDIFFRQGEYNPGSSSGRELLAHELTHVVQQNGANVQSKLSISQPSNPYARQADKIAKAVLQREQQIARQEADDGLVHRQSEEEKDDQIQTKAKHSNIQKRESSARLTRFKLNSVPQITRIQLYPKSKGGRTIKLTKPRNPPDILVPEVTKGYDVDGDLNVGWPIVSDTASSRGWFLEGDSYEGKPGKAYRFASFSTNFSEGDHCSASALGKGKKQGKALLTIAAKVSSGGWIEDKVSFQVYMHGYTKHPLTSVVGKPQSKAFLGDVFRTENPPHNPTTITMKEGFSQGWSSSATRSTAFTDATSSTHGFNVGVSGELGKDKVGKIGADFGYNYSTTDQKTVTSAMNSTMAINSTVHKSVDVPLAPGYVGALVPYGQTVAFWIPSIKAKNGWVTNDKGHLAMIGAKVMGVHPVIVKMAKGEKLADAMARREKEIKAFVPPKMNP